MARHIGTDLYDAFLAVAETGGFSAAVERLHRTQATISQQIQRLETLVGRDLFARTTRHVELTVAGETLVPYARKILLLNEQATRAANREADGTVRIGVPDIYSEAVLPRIVEALRTVDPDVVPIVCCDHSMQLQERFSTGGLDVILAGRCRGFEVGRTVCTEELIWAGAEGVGDGWGDTVPLLLHSDGCPFRALALAALREAGIDWKVVYMGQSSAAINPSLAHGLGITAMPNRLMESGLSDMGKALGLPEIQTAPIDLQVSMSLVARYGEDFKFDLVKVCMETLNCEREEGAASMHAVQGDRQPRLAQARPASGGSGCTCTWDDAGRLCSTCRPAG